MELFDSNIFRENRLAFYSEPVYNHLNISDRIEEKEIREKLERWFAKYPVSEQNEFTKRFKTSRNTQLHSAFFELLIHEVLLRLGYKVIIHPVLENNTSRPDFLVQSQTGEEFYLEVVTFTGMTKEEEAQKKIIDQISDTINKLKTYNYYIKFRVIKYPTLPLPGKRIKGFLESRLKQLSPDFCNYITNTFGEGARPKWSFSNDDYELEFLPIPKAKEFWDELTEKPIGIRSGEVRWMNYKGDLNKEFKKKSKYGALGKPYILAFNYLAWFSPYRHIIDVLYGSINYDTYTNNENPRLDDGIWSRNISSAYRNISGLLFINQLYPWATHFQNFEMYLNPWAKMPYNGKLFYFPFMECKDGRISEHEGSKLSELLEIENPA